MTAIKLTGVFNEHKSIVDKIKKHIATEMQEYKEYMDSDYEDSFKMLCMRAETNMLKVY